jgi:hypothetical protein
VGCNWPTSLTAAGVRRWLRFRWLGLILLGLVNVGYAFSLVRAPDTISAPIFYWFIYSGGAMIAAGLIEQGHNLERPTV